ncbi:conserved Plasmodium protein, unknown function [Plasmodium vinckei vinckei]|uniref:Uncharacterized protein n=1 Tax=Plasmodium vinckei vinckei TaxID=54757 RepID=A0A449C134_PLAVN|nr:conserved Plasmodium protein, unknown function [Plasmodium vinckei vinckei]KEG03806.1 hypothetical protein YYE_00708 [Plasmodium vinckei vinckei]VEV59399.1 conserved Plasmodium protein, unknown function [Plasmodium vinckei vinckei]
MKRVKNSVVNFSAFDLSNKQSLINFYKSLNREYICGEIHNNLILNPDPKSSFLYFEHRQNEIILGFKDTNNELYQKLIKIKDSYIFDESQTKTDQDIGNLIKDIKNYSYIQGGAMITFHKQLLKNYVALQIQKFKEIQDK